MKKISRITTQQRNKERYNIFVVEDGHESYGFSVDEAILIQYMLKKGMDLTDELLEKILRQNSLYEAYTQAIHYLSYRMRSKKEIVDFLRKKEVEAEQIEAVMDRLAEEKLTDDLEFARMFVRTRIRTSDKGPSFIRRELAEKGVSVQHIDQALSLYTFDLQLEKAVKLAEKKQRSGKQESHKMLVQRIGANLMQKGFASDVVKEALAAVKEESDGDAEMEALANQGDRLIRRHERTLEGFSLKQKVKEGLYRKGFPMDAINDYLEQALS